MPFPALLSLPFSLRLSRRKAAGSTAAALALSALCPPHTYAAPYQVRDINRTPPASPRSTTMYFRTSNGPLSFFSVTTEAEGPELWRTDGTPAGTELIRDIFPGPKGSFPGPCFSHKGILYFSAESPDGDYLWRSDGTTGGTWPLRSDVALPRAFTTVGNTLFFAAYHEPGTQPSRHTLWRSDGTKEGTVLVDPELEFDDTYSADSLVAFGNLLYFRARKAGDSVPRFWKSDGTSSGTVPLTSGGVPVPPPSTLFQSNGTLYFNTPQNNQYTLWRSDGTDSGTTAITHLAVYPDQATGQVVTLNGIMYFAGWNGTGGIELWRSDGTAGGTSMVKDIYPGSFGSAPADLTVWNGHLYFSASESPFLRKLWKSDGSAEGTRVIPGPEFSSSNSGSLTLFKNTFYAVSDLTSGFNLWKSDGTDTGTTLARNLFPSPSTGNVLIQAATSETLYLTVADTNLGSELWKTNGTPAGTALVRNTSPDTYNNSTPGRLTDLAGTLLFAAQDTPTGRELWKSNGTDSGTTLVRDIHPGPGSFFRAPSIYDYSSEGRPLAASGFLYFYGHDGTGGFDLARSNGTAPGTALLRDFGPLHTNSSEPAEFVLSEGQIFFTPQTYTEGIELWKTDGTSSGTQLVRDLAPGITSGMGGSGGNSSVPRNLTDMNGRLFFTTGNGPLWVSDGTSSGTQSVPWPASLNPLRNGPLCRLGSTLLLVSQTTAYGNELWKLDGGTSVPVLLRDIRPGTAGAFLGSNGIDGETDQLAAANGTAWFAAHDGVSDGLWKTDGTAAGTILVKRFSAGGISRTTAFLPAGASLYFAANDGVHGFELWKSDGTEAGTQMVADLAPGPAGSFPEKLLQPVPGGPVVFQANDGPHGHELWRTAGTAASTRLLTDITPAPRSSNIGSLTISGSHLFFSAGRTDTPSSPGIELWALPLSDITAAGLSEDDWSLYE